MPLQGRGELMPQYIRIYHRTPYARVICAQGFCDSEDDPPWSQGIWVATAPVTEGPLGKGAKGNELLMLEIPVTLFEAYERPEDCDGARVALIPATRLNQHRPFFCLDEWPEEWTESEVSRMGICRVNGAVIPLARIMYAPSIRSGTPDQEEHR